MQDKHLKTEQPTPRRIEKARREGQFLTSREFMGAIQFLAFVAVLCTWGGQWFAGVGEAARWILRRAFAPDLGAVEIVKLLQEIVWRAFAPLLLAGAGLVMMALATHLLMTKMGFSLKKLTPDLKRLNPISRVRELLSQNVWALAKAVVMLPFFGVAVYFIAKDNVPTYIVLPLMALETGVRHVAGSITELLWKAAGVFLVLGSVDLLRQRRRHQQELRMSKREVRDELKDMEGNPQIRARIRRLRRELLRRQMMREVKTATAVIVNPTHYAVAIRYRLESMSAPVVVAKGKNYLAQRIRARAIEHQIPLIENPPLAQALYKAVEVGQQIPAHLYRAVAEVLAYIYRLMNGRLPG
jgi:flagellar biosynthetic protein FlhB